MISLMDVFDAIPPHVFVFLLMFSIPLTHFQAWSRSTSKKNGWQHIAIDVLGIMSFVFLVANALFIKAYLLGAASK